MKRIVPPAEPTVLAAFRDAHPGATWGEFKDERGHEAVFDALAASQGHLCAYCEIDISRPLSGEVEHVVPKSSSTPERNLHLDFSNLVACCEGGTRRDQTRRSAEPLRKTIHCGALKGDDDPAGRMLDPRDLPSAPIWSVSPQGEIAADPEACARAGIDADMARRTIDFLGLNRTVLVRLRRETHKALDDEVLSQATSDADIDAAYVALATILLIPDEDGHLPQFWSTIRAAAGPAIEPWIEANRGRIPGL